MTKNRTLVDAIKTDYQKADIGEKDVAMLEYAELLTRTPSKVKKSDIQKLKKLGFEDADILVMVQVIAYFAYVNRMAEGLGVELESYWDDE